MFVYGRLSHCLGVQVLRIDSKRFVYGGSIRLSGAWQISLPYIAMTGLVVSPVAWVVA